VALPRVHQDVLWGELALRTVHSFSRRTVSGLGHSIGLTIN
jgi:hypothetical protein